MPLSTTHDSHHRLVVLGVDPGTLVTGFGVVERRGGVLHLLSAGMIRNRSTEAMPLRLQRIFQGLRELIARHRPDVCAVESAFYGKNAQSALKLGQARGVALLAAAEGSIPAAEYSPREVKRAVVGNGQASKEQVRFMVRSLLSLDGAAMVLDTSDAVAVALCHLQRASVPATHHGDWKSYIAAHPERVRS